MSNVENWRKSYSETSEKPPEPNDILRGYNGAPARLTIELVEGSPPFIYGRAHVPNLVGQAIDGWVLQHFDTKSNYGWKCVLLPKAREEVLRRYPKLPQFIAVNALRVVRLSRSGNSLLCEIAEWCDEQPPMPIDEEFTEGTTTLDVAEAA